MKNAANKSKEPEYRAEKYSKLLKKTTPPKNETTQF